MKLWKQNSNRSSAKSKESMMKKPWLKSDSIFDSMQKERMVEIAQFWSFVKNIDVISTGIPKHLCSVSQISDLKDCVESSLKHEEEKLKRNIMQYLAELNESSERYILFSKCFWERKISSEVASNKLGSQNNPNLH